MRLRLQFAAIVVVAVVVIRLTAIHTPPRATPAIAAAAAVPFRAGGFALALTCAPVDHRGGITVQVRMFVVPHEPELTRLGRLRRAHQRLRRVGHKRLIHRHLPHIKRLHRHLPPHGVMPAWGHRSAAPVPVKRRLLEKGGGGTQCTHAVVGGARAAADVDGDAEGGPHAHACGAECFKLGVLGVLLLRLPDLCSPRTEEESVQAGLRQDLLCTGKVKNTKGGGCVGGVEGRM